MEPYVGNGYRSAHGKGDGGIKGRDSPQFARHGNTMYQGPSVMQTPSVLISYRPPPPPPPPSPSLSSFAVCMSLFWPMSLILHPLNSAHLFFRITHSQEPPLQTKAHTLSQMHTRTNAHTHPWL